MNKYANNEHKNKYANNVNIFQEIHHLKYTNRMLKIQTMLIYLHKISDVIDSNIGND